ncbi:hypothetical protein [Saccharopolyspora spinosa]|uniref:HTH HARE-type domain-containing protein n=1 Tax=Saccharopolyspora spinosa TaxID=60894 RepID=A0A2N3XWJ6_SACSN|nr:hypothetical protein [Saccharopolyspora spinosa]PKW14991.1 hypothetical protein A8926_2654 [Saccharopolyspora spinosa]
MAEPKPRKRRPHNELKNAMREYLARKGGGPASISEIKDAVYDEVGEAPDSSFRSALQDERYFVRVERGVFRLRD